MCKDCKKAFDVLYETEYRKSKEYLRDKITWDEYRTSYHDALAVARKTTDNCKDVD